VRILHRIASALPEIAEDGDSLDVLHDQVSYTASAIAAEGLELVGRRSLAANWLTLTTAAQKVFEVDLHNA
jgi:hypothetical protein